MGGQQGATLYRSTGILDITNKIKGDWQENLAGLKAWNVICDGLYVTDNAALETLESAFMNSKPLQISLQYNDKTLTGKCYIIDFPLTAIFNKEFKYTIKLMGSGALEEKR